MDDDLPIISKAVDLTKAPPINCKRTLAFVNHFITHTVQFLNRFSGDCEQKLSGVHNRITNLELTLGLLEAKLASIPGLENVQASAKQSTQQPTQQPINQPTTQPTTQPISQPDKSSEVAQPSPSVELSTSLEVPESDAQDTPVSANPVSADPRYARFFKMVKMGVPEPAVKVKMTAEGIDPDILDDPDAPAPDAGEENEDGDSSSSEASSFSDDD